MADGEWMLDYNNSVKKDNGQGGFNSVITVGKANEKSTELMTSTFVESELTVLVKGEMSGFYVLWEHYDITDNCKKMDDLILIPIPINAKETDRSHIRVWAYNEQKASNDILIPLQNGLVLMNKFLTIDTFTLY